MPASALDIDLWSVALDAADEIVAALSAILSEEERERAQRFAFPHLRRRFIVRRGVLRMLVGAYIDEIPRSVVFRSAGMGKPAVDGAPYFNASQSSDLAVYAFTRTGEIGIDVERMRTIENAEDIARRFFAPRELEELVAARRDRRDEAFLKFWTRKEAYLKAIGAGLSAPPDALESEPSMQWRIHDLAPADGYVGALAVPNAEAVPGPWRHLSSPDFFRNSEISSMIRASSFHQVK